MAIDERLLELMRFQHWNQQNFAEFLGISPATLSSILKKRTKVTLSTVLAIKKKFPTLNYSWLLDGTGPMFLDDKSGASSSSSTPSPSSDSEQFIDFEENSEHTNEAAANSGADSSISEQVVPANGETTLNRQTQQNSVSSGKTGAAQRNNPSIVVPKKLNIIRRNVSQILVIYDDQTCETFVPKK